MALVRRTLKLLDGRGSGVDVLLGLLKEVAEFGKLRLDCAQRGPDVVTSFLDGQRAESHLQAAEQGTQGGRSRNIYELRNHPM